MSNLLRPVGPSIAGEIFYITDGKPTHMGFWFDPLIPLCNHQLNIGHLLPLRLVQVLLKWFKMVAIIIGFLSEIIGKTVSIPSWGFSYMESHKVQL